MENYTCGISGATADPSEDTDEVLDDLPVGWARVVVSIRRENPRYQQIVEAVEALCDHNLSAIPEGDARNAAETTMHLIAEATFAALLAATPPYLTEEHEAFVCEAQLPALMPYLGIVAVQQDESES